MAFDEFGWISMRARPIGSSAYLREHARVSLRAKRQDVSSKASPQRVTAFAKELRERYLRDYPSGLRTRCHSEGVSSRTSESVMTKKVFGFRRDKRSCSRSRS